MLAKDLPPLNYNNHMGQKSRQHTFVSKVLKDVTNITEIVVMCILILYIHNFYISATTD